MKLITGRILFVVVAALAALGSQAVENGEDDKVKDERTAAGDDADPRPVVERGDSNPKNDAINPGNRLPENEKSKVEVGNGPLPPAQQQNVVQESARGNPEAQRGNQQAPRGNQDAVRGNQDVPRVQEGARELPRKAQRAGPSGGLADSPACADEISRHCRNIPRGSDIAILQCLQDAGDTDDILSPGCQQELWHLKVNLTQDDRFRQAAMQFCATELTQFPQCQSMGSTAERGHLLGCLIDFKDNMTNNQCRSFLTRMETIIFSDFRLVGQFVRTCKQEIDHFQCGQWDNLDGTKQQQQQQQGVKHSQGSTLECLLKKFVDSNQNSNDLSPQCRHEVLRLAELQADDFNLDRPLYFACRNDRERLCHDVQAGSGRVFQCLVKQLEGRDLTVECRETLMVRLKLMQRDYKYSHALVQNCQQSISENQCAPKGLDEQPDHFFLTYILLCLENAGRQNKVIPTNCQTQMFEHRRLMMSEAKMDPEVILACSHDIATHCRQLEGGGVTLHCLMAVARTPVSANTPGLQPPCFQAIAKLLQAVDVGSNYKVDRVLYNDCKPLIEGICQKQAARETDVLSCLMNNVESPQMSEECEERLLEVQYFLARDFRLDPQLYKACSKDAEEKCGHSGNWLEPVQRGKDAKQGPDRGYLILTCLYRHAYINEDGQHDYKLSDTCAVEVRRVMRERSISVHLMPHIEVACLTDLAQHCSQRTKPGEEMMCLQENMDQLQDLCKAEVKNFTALQSKDTKLAKVLNRACRPVVEKYCREFLGEDVDNGDVTECLVQNKAAPEMTNKCRTYVNHYELLSLKDYTLSFKFRQSCRKDIETNCLGTGQTDKVSIIRCLSDLVIERTLLGSGVEISKECRKQLKSEYFKMETMPMVNWKKADPQFASFCEADLNSFGCDKEPSMEKAVECLKEKKSELNAQCKKYIFRRERLEFGDNSFDSTLNRVCADEINRFCSRVDRAHTLHCLKEHKNDQAMSVDCLQVVERRQREQATDIRLQPVLYRTCKSDIERYCKTEFEQMKSQKRGEEADLQAEIITCLRKTFVKTPLSLSCLQEVKKIVYDSEVDPRLDPPFYQHCKKDIDRLCTDTLMASEGHRGIVECMSVKYKSNLIADLKCKKDLERKVNEIMFDIHLDEVLYDVCSLDLKRFCYDVPAGNGNQLKCLLMASQSANVHMSDQCKGKLIDRKVLWQSMSQSGGLVIPSDLGGFAEILSASPARNTFMTVLLCVVLVIFVFGLCCGRATKRIRQELKNR